MNLPLDYSCGHVRSHTVRRPPHQHFGTFFPALSSSSAVIYYWCSWLYFAGAKNLFALDVSTVTVWQGLIMTMFLVDPNENEWEIEFAPLSRGAYSLLISFELSLFFFSFNRKSRIEIKTLSFLASVSCPRRRAARKTKVTTDIKALLKTIKCTSHVINITVANHHRIRLEKLK